MVAGVGQLGKLSVLLELNSARFQAGMQKVEKSINGLEGHVKRLSRSLTAGFTTIGVVHLGRSIVQTGLELKRMETALKSVTGSQAAADQAMQFVADTADRLGINLLAASDGYAKLVASAKGSVVEGKATEELFIAIAEASRALGFSAADTGGILRAFGQVMSKGKVQAEELRGQIGERLYGAFQLAAESIGLSTKELDKMLEQGKVGLEIIPSLTRVLREDFSEAAAEAAKGPAAELERFNTRMIELKGSLSTVLIPAVVLVTKVLRGLIWVVEQTIAGFRIWWQWLRDNVVEVRLLAEGVTWLIRKFDELRIAMKPIAELSIEQTQEQIRMTTDRIEELRGALADLQQAGPYTGDPAAASAMRQELEFLQNRLRELQQHLAASEIAANKLGETGTRALGDLATAAGDAANIFSRDLVAGIDAAREAADEISGVLEKHGLVLEDISRETLILNAALDQGTITFDEYAEAMGFADEQTTKTTGSLFDMAEAVKTVQSNLQNNLSGTIYDAIYGDRQQLKERKQELRDDLRDTLQRIKQQEADKTITHAEAIEQRRTAEEDFQRDMDKLIKDGSKSWSGYIKDFARSTLETFVKLISDIAAAWAASKIFKLPTNFGFSLGGLGPHISGGGIGGGIGQGVGVAGGLGKISSTISGGLGRIVTGLKSIFGGGTATAAGNLGFKGPAAFATSGGGGGIGAAGALVPLGIAAMGFGIQSSRKDARRQLQNQFFTQVGTGITEDLGESTFDFRGQLDAATAFFSTTNAGWQATIKALIDLDVLTGSWGAQLDERGQQLVKVQGDIGGMKTALSEAVATGFDFAGSLEMAIEKGQNMRVAIEGDAEAIETALNAATSMGIGGFRDLETTASGVTATLTGDIALWESYLQGFVTESLRDAINGVGSLGEQAGSATQMFLDLAAAASKVKVGSTVTGGRAAQVDGFADGGISTSPGLAMVSEGRFRNEAHVPLPDGRTIPVTVRGGVSSASTDKLLGDINRVLRRIERKPADRAI